VSHPRIISLLARIDENVVPFLTVNFTAIPWDFYFILAAMGIVIPWRGALRIKTFLKRPELSAADRLSLYGSTIAFQSIIVALVGWRAYSRKMSFNELGLTTGYPWKTIEITVCVTLVLCAIQLASLRRLVRMPVGERGPVFEVTERIMPHSPAEMLVFTALACTAGLSEEFLYRGFVYAVFGRIFENSAFPIVIAATLSSLWFGLAHLYQGRRGIITTFVVGMIFCLARILSGSLFPPVAAHIGVDLIAGLYILTSSQTLRQATRA
jgi:membrane protease YdiL (CAAX protease family)